MNTQTKISVLQAVDPLLDAIGELEQALMISNNVIIRVGGITKAEMEALRKHMKDAEAFILKFKNIMGNDLTTSNTKGG